MWLLGLLLVSCAAPAAAQDQAAVGARKQALAARTESAPRIDGSLDDAQWQNATPIVDFVQHEPHEGEAPTEKTEVRILYDSAHLYIAVRCYDTEPARILVSESQRDSGLIDTDAFWMVLDTFRDRRNGFVFGTNPRGLEFDGQVANDGGDSSVGGAGPVAQPTTQRGTGGDFNKNWDGTWRVRTAVDALGWTAEFAIPLTTLRFPDTRSQIWGVNFARNIRRKNEQVYWSPVPRHRDLYRVSLAGDLAGLDLKQPRNLKLTPYVLGSVQRDYTVHRDPRGVRAWGGDLKYSLTPNLTLDVTYNTDFAQVEVDEQQVNLTRFNLFFPEKRPFFLENAGLFTVGTPGQVELFFSRRIGLDRVNQVVPIHGGARLSGRVGQWNLGLLNMQTDEPGSAGTNFLVTKISRQFGRRSAIGTLFINKQGTGSAPDIFNRTVAVDGRVGRGDALLISGFVARTITSASGVADDVTGVAYNLAGSYRTRTYGFNLGYSEVGDGFNPEVGFLERPTFRRLNGGVSTYFRFPSVKWLRQLGPHVTWRRYMDLNGAPESETLHLDSHVDWANGTHFSPAIDILYEQLRAPFEVFPGVVVPPGSYQHPTLAWRFNSNLSAPLAVSLALDAGGFYTGSLRSYRGTVTWRHGSQLVVSTGYTRNDARFPIAGANREFGGRFIGDLVSTRASYSFTPRLYLQSLIQYNDAADNWAVNLRFGWLNTAGTGLFVVYNETQDLEDIDLVRRPRVLAGAPVNRAVYLKFTREFRIFE